ncbi:MAG TPA: hypothetical protein VF798_01440, partial [Burkholderiaceae bacterium]
PKKTCRDTRPPVDKLAAYVSARVGLGPHADAGEVKPWVAILAGAMGMPSVLGGFTPHAMSLPAVPCG